MAAPLEVGICCRDLEQLLRFYVDVLGCTPVSTIEVGVDRARAAHLSSDSYRVARLQTQWGERIKLLQPVPQPTPAETTEWILDRQGAAYLTFIVDDLEAVVDKLRSEHIELMTGRHPVEVRPGVWLAFARDPESNVLEFVEYEALRDYRADVTPTATRV